MADGRFAFTAIKNLPKISPHVERFLNDFTDDLDALAFNVRHGIQQHSKDRTRLFFSSKGTYTSVQSANYVPSVMQSIFTTIR